MSYVITAQEMIDRLTSSQSAPRETAGRGCGERKGCTGEPGRRAVFNRLVSSVMIAVMLFATGPAPIAYALSPIVSQRPQAVASNAVAIHAKTGPHKLSKFAPQLKFSQSPTDLELSSARVFVEPLAPMSGRKMPGENEALAEALHAFEQKSDPEDLSMLTKFMDNFPKSRWFAAVEMNVGLMRLNTGHLTEAQRLLHDAWDRAKDETAEAQMAVANRSVARLLLTKARLGQTDDLRRMLKLVAKRAFRGSDEEMVQGARLGLMTMQSDPSIAYRCGPFAIDSVQAALKPGAKFNPITERVKSTKNGTSLAQVKRWADECGLNFQLAKRGKGAPIVVPSIMHWAVGHFAAIISKETGHYTLKDPTFDTDATIGIGEGTIDSESDGYFLIPAGKLPPGWQTLSIAEAGKVWGRGSAHGPDPGKSKKRAPKTCTTECCQGMAKAGAWLMNAALNIVDTPLSYRPPIGPMMNFSLNFTHLQPGQPSTFTFTNFGPNWSFNFESYLVIDPVSQNATITSPDDSGSETFIKSGGVYTTTDTLSQATFASAGGGAYTRALPDGTVQTFGQSDGSRIYLTQITDPQGNSVLIQYDTNFRITTITDAVNQVSTLAYVSNSFGNSGFYKVASITDPFGRSASFSYDSSNVNLTSITDCVGLTSKFIYDSSSTFITSMSTAYGVTAFYNYVPGNNGYPAVGLRTTLPDGTSTVLENWPAETKASYYWDREATALYPNDPALQNYTHCVTTRFVYQSSNQLEGAAPQTVQKPLESLVQYAYPNQISTNYQGSLDKPSSISQALSAQSTVVTIGGTLTVNDVVGLAVSDSGVFNFYYTIQTGDTTATVMTNLANLVNVNATMQKQGDFAVANGNTVTLSSNGQSAIFSGINGATETFTSKSAVVQNQVYTVSGTATPGDTITIVTAAPQLGNQGATYTVVTGDSLSNVAAGLAAQINANATLSANGISATSAGPIVTVTSNYYEAINSFFYNGATEYLTEVQRNGATRGWDYQYNSIGNVIKSTDPMNRTFTYQYASNQIDLMQITETQASDNFQVGAWTFNSIHRPLTYTDGSGQVTHYAYNNEGQLTSITDANSNVTALSYIDGSEATIGGTKTTGDILTITVFNSGLSGGQKAINYTALAGDSLASEASGLAAGINADVNLQAQGIRASTSGTIVRMFSTSANATTYTASKSSGATETISASNNTFGYLTKIDGPLSGSSDVTTFGYDTVGRLASRTDSEGYTVSFLYDNMDRMTQTSYPDGTTEQTVYNRLDAVLKKDRIGRTTQDSFDSLDQLAFEIDPLGRKTQYSWCICGSLGALTDPAGNVTTWNHDLQGRPIKKIYADGTSVSYVYEPYASRLRQKTDALGQTTLYNNNPDDTPIQVAYFNAVNATSPTTYAWDPAYKRLSSVNKTDWGTISYTYNAYIAPGGTATTGGGMLQKVHNNVIANSDITYSYDVLGRTTNRSINGASNSITWAYDAMSRITSEANALGTFSYAYVDDVSGSSKGTTRLASITYPNSQVTNFGWYGNTGDQRLQQIQNLNPTGGMLSQFNYGYDSAGQITQWQQQQNSNNLFYNLGYDQAGQLTSASAGSGGPTNPAANEFRYAYDSAANRTSVQQATMQTVRVGGTKTTGDTLTITVNDPALTGGTEAVSYLVLSGDTLASIAAGLANAVNKDTNLQALGVIANAHGTNTFINIRSASTNITTFALSKSGGATETLTAGIFKNGLENLVIGGTKTTGDVVTFKVTDPALTGGSHTVSYTTLSGDNLNSIASAVKAAINADSQFSTLGVSATSALNVVSIASNSSNVTSYSTSVSGSATETMTLSVNQNPTMLASIGGTKTTGDVLTLNFYDSGLAGGTQAISYTMLSGDTLSSATTALTSAINASSALSNQGVTATSSGTVITITSKSPNTTTYVPSYSASATESILVSIPTFGWQVAALGGTKTTGDVVTITVFDAGLSGGKLAVPYTVLSGDSLASIASALASAINGNSNLSALGISASASSTILSLESTSPNMTTYAQSTNSGATETIALGKNMGVQQASFNNVNELTALSAGGAARVQGVSDKPLKSATTQGQIVQISATAPSASSISAVASKTATESIAVANVSPQSYWTNGSVYNATITGTASVGDVLNFTVFDTRLSSGSETISYVVKSGDSINSIASSMSAALDADTNLTNLGYISYTGSNVFSINCPDSTTYSSNSTGFANNIFGLGSETISFATNSDNNETLTLGGTATTGDIVSVTVQNANLAGGQETASYTVASGNTLTNVATGVAAAINADTHLAAQGIGASSSGAVVTISTDTSYTVSTSGGATETISAGTSYHGNVQITLGGKPTTSDTVTITVHNPSLSGGSKAETYTVTATDQMGSIAAGLASLINGDAAMKTLGISVNNSAQLAFSESFSGDAIVPSGVSTAQGSGGDGSSNTATNPVQVNVNGGTAATLTFDQNGNMTSDGTNLFSWDCENRLIKITYPGTNNYSAFSYDGLSRNVKIVETTAGSVTSTKQFVWCGEDRCEQRDASSSITAQFFSLGETISGTSYFYTTDHLGLSASSVVPFAQPLKAAGHTQGFNPLGHSGSVREMTNSSGAIQDQRTYDSFGRVTKLQGSLTSDMQFAGYYFHGPSGLNLTLTRAYNPAFGRWSSRDPIEEQGGVNLYDYVKNEPVDTTDPTGRFGVKTCLVHCGVKEGTPLACCLNAAKTPLNAIGCIVKYGGKYAWCLKRCIFNDDLGIPAPNIGDFDSPPPYGGEA